MFVNEKKLVACCCFFSQYIVHSQYHEIGLFIGGANYVGDVGSSNYVYPENPALGLFTSGIELRVILCVQISCIPP